MMQRVQIQVDPPNEPEKFVEGLVDLSDVEAVRMSKIDETVTVLFFRSGLGLEIAAPVSEVIGWFDR